MSYLYFDSLPVEARTRYLNKLQLVGLDKCPYKIPGDMWIDDMKSWPAVRYMDIFHYLINFPRVYSTDVMENYRSLEAWRFFESGWVGVTFHLRTPTDHFVFKADVRPSYRINEEPHHPWISTNLSGKVICAHCDCMAGLGETCSHVGALLFKIEAAVRGGHTQRICTDEPCTWNSCERDVTPSPVANIRFYTKSSRESVKKPRKRQHNEATDDQMDTFLTGLSSLPYKVVGLCAFTKFNSPFKVERTAPPKQQLPKTLSERFCSETVSDSWEVINKLLEVTPAEIDYVQSVTINQSSSLHWHQQRVGRITSSNAHAVLHTSPISPARSLINSICSNSTRPLTVPAVLWSSQHESDAYALYSHLMSNTPLPKDIVIPSGVIHFSSNTEHNDFNVCKCGLTISFDFPYLGSSPDGCVNCDCHGNGLLEIKCPFKHKHDSINAMVNTPGFCLDSDCHLKKCHSYYSQVQHQMLVCNAQYVDFMVWTPTDCIIDRVHRDEEFICDMIPKLELFWKTCILPELCHPKEVSHVSVPVSGSGNGKMLYCFCKTSVEDERVMVGCDSCDNWYHLECLKLKRTPAAKTWYCPECKKRKKKK